MQPSTVVRPHRRLTTSLLVAILFGSSVPTLRAQLNAQQQVTAKQQRATTKTPVKKAGAPAPKPASPTELKIQAIENALVPVIRLKGKPVPGLSLAARMKKYHVQGVSIAVINDGAIEWARAYGVADAATKTPVDTTTGFQAGAAGEPVAAFAALRLTQSKKLEISKDVNKSLKSWKVPKSDVTKKRAVTLRALMSHSSGLTVTEAPSYSQSNGLPTLTQILYGTPPATTPSVVSIETPGETARYSAADFAVVQQMLEDVTKRSFASFATDSVLLPLGMSHSAFEQPPGDAYARHAATGHDTNGKPLAGKWRLYPEAASAGLWTTPSDLARLVMEIQEASAGRPGKVLGTDAARQVLDAEHMGWPGLGVWLDGRDANARFRAVGETEGFEAVMVGYVERGQGAVVMVNTAGGGALIEEIMNAIAAAYGWPGFVPPERVIAKVDPKVYDRFVGRYTSEDHEMSVAKKANRLFVGPAGKETVEIFPESVSDFFTPEPAAIYSFVFDESGKVQAVTQKQRETSVRWDRKK